MEYPFSAFLFNMKKILTTHLSPQIIPQYDKFILSHPQGWISTHSGWIKVLESAFPQIKGNSVIFHDSKEDKILGALPLCKVKSSLTVPRLVSVPFCSISEPLFMEIDYSSLTETFDKLLSDTNSSHIEIRVASEQSINQLLANLKPSSIYKCHIIDLNRPLNTILKSIHASSIRHYINKAAAFGAQIRHAKNQSDIIAFYKLYSHTRKNLYLPAMPFKFFESIWEVFSPTDNVNFLLLELDKTPVASMMFFKFGNRVSVEALGWDKKFTKLHAVKALYWEAIKTAHSEGYKIFDFGRTDPLNKSLMDFKSRWGTYVTDLPVFIYPQSAAKRNTASRMKPLALRLQKILFGMPQPFYGWISGFCYRHMG